MKTEEKKTIISYAEDVISMVRQLLDKYMEKFKGYHELQQFMEDENNLYDSDGMPTTEYKDKIAEVEAFIKKQSFAAFLKEQLVHSEQDESVIDGIVNFVEKRKELICEITNEESRLGEDYNAEEYIEQLISSAEDEEKAFIVESLQSLAEKDALEALDNEAVREGLKEVINYKS